MRIQDETSIHNKKTGYKTIIVTWIHARRSLTLSFGFGLPAPLHCRSDSSLMISCKTSELIPRFMNRYPISFTLLLHLNLGMKQGLEVNLGPKGRATFQITLLYTTQYVVLLKLCQQRVGSYWKLRKHGEILGFYWLHWKWEQARSFEVWIPSLFAWARKLATMMMTLTL